MGKAPFMVPKPLGVPDVVERLTAVFAAIAGVGEKTARRYALSYAMGDLSDTGPAALLAQVLTVMRKTVHRCPRCFSITDTVGDEHCIGVCSICADPKRENGQLCVVATIQHMLAIEKSGAFRGRYLILGKLISPLEGVEAGDLPLDAFETIITMGMEVILALPVTVEGDATAMVIQRNLDGIGVRVTRIAAGMPHGGDIEHADQVTIGRALAERKEAK
jgi:recombination protein RecR